MAFDQADFLGYWPVALLAWRNRYLIGDPKLSGVQGQSANNSRGISMSTGMYQASQSTPDDDVTGGDHLRTRIDVADDDHMALMIDRATRAQRLTQEQAIGFPIW